jgi:hypothetical protein
MAEITDQVGAFTDDLRSEVFRSLHGQFIRNFLNALLSQEEGVLESNGFSRSGRIFGIKKEFNYSSVTSR